MARVINFVANRRKRLTSEQKRDEQWFTYALIAVSSIFVVFLLSVGVRFFFVHQLSTLEEEQRNTRLAIESQETVEKEYTVFAHKLRALSDLFGKRQDKQEAMLYFSQVFGPQVIISGIEYSESDDSIVSFTLNAPSVFDLENVFTILESDEVKENYSKVYKSGLGRGESGAYSLKLTIVLGDSTYLDDVAASAASAEVDAAVQDALEEDQTNTGFLEN